MQIDGYSIAMTIGPAIIGLLGVFIGASLVDRQKQSEEKRQLYRKIVIFYKSRIEKLKSLEGSMLTHYDEQELTISRAPLLAELLLIGSKSVIDLEQNFYHALWSRETNFKLKRMHYKKTGSQVFVNLGKGLQRELSVFFSAS